MDLGEAIARLVDRGAMFTPTLSGVPTPVGLMRQVDAGRWFWWEAGGESEFAGHMVDADKVAVHHGGLAVEFTRKGEFAGYLTTCFEATLDDPATADAMETIRSWRAEYDRRADLRGFIERRVESISNT